MRMGMDMRLHIDMHMDSVFGMYQVVRKLIMTGVVAFFPPSDSTTQIALAALCALAFLLLSTSFRPFKEGGHVEHLNFIAQTSTLVTLLIVVFMRSGITEEGSLSQGVLDFVLFLCQASPPLYGLYMTIESASLTFLEQRRSRRDRRKTNKILLDQISFSADSTKGASSSASSSSKRSWAAGQGGALQAIVKQLPLSPRNLKDNKVAPELTKTPAEVALEISKTMEEGSTSSSNEKGQGVKSTSPAPHGDSLVGTGTSPVRVPPEDSAAVLASTAGAQSHNQHATHGASSAHGVQEAEERAPAPVWEAEERIAEEEKLDRLEGMLREAIVTVSRAEAKVTLSKVDGHLGKALNRLKRQAEEGETSFHAAGARPSP